MKRLKVFILITQLFAMFQIAAESNNFIEFNTQNRHEYIYDITQDSLGYIWLATGQGLKRIDDETMVNYTEENTSLRSQVIKTVDIIDDIIWFTNSYGQIFQLSGHLTSEFTTPFKRSIVACLSEKDNLIFVSKGEGIYIYNQKSKSGKLYTNNKKIIHTAKKINDKIIVGTEDGLEQLVLENDTLNIKKIISNQEITSICQLNNHIILGTNNQGLQIINGELNSKIKPFQKELISITSTIKDILVDTEGNLWVATFREGLIKFIFDEETQSFASFAKEPIPSTYKSINKTFQDNENNLWVATYGKGLLFQVNDFVTQIKSTNNTGHRPVKAINRKEHTLYYASKNTVLILNQNSEIDTLFTLNEEIEINSLDFYNDHILLIGCTHHGLYKANINNGEISKIHFHENIITQKINSILVENEKIWLATYDGLFCLDIQGNILERFTTENGLRHNLINTIAIKSNGCIVVGTKSNRIFFIKNHLVKELKLPSDYPNINVTEILVSTNDKLYIGTMGNGLFTIEGDKIAHFTQKEGLKSNYIYGLVSIDENQVLLYSESSVSIYDSKTGSIKNIETKYDQHAEYITRANAKFISNNIYIGTKEGLFIFNTKKYFNTIFVPNLGFTEISINDSIYDIAAIDDLIPLKYGTHKIEIDFKSVNYSLNENLTYYYKLHGFDKEWHQTKNTSAQYKQLKSGSYQFEIKACNFDNCTTKKTHFRIEIQNPFWESYWFIVSCFILSVWLIILMFYLQGRKNKRNKKILEQSIKVKNQELRLRNNDLTTSIKYTKLIQDTSSKSISNIDNSFLESFVIKESKHIVSGDFSWIEKTDTHVVFALGDPQKIGIPGGLLSIWCSNILNNTVVKHGIDNPKIILDFLHESIKKELNKTINHSINLIVGSIHIENQTLTISSANHDAVFISQSKDLEYIKKTPKALGEENPGIKFSNSTFDLKKYNAFYFYTDGLKTLHQEATSGTEQELITLLQQHAHEDINEQKQNLSYLFEKWIEKQNNTIQDDYTLLGFSIKR